MVCRHGVLVHCLCRLNAASRVLAIELHCGDGVFTKSAIEFGKARHLFDDVMSHNSIVGAHPWHDSELKFSGSPIPDGNWRGGEGNRAELTGHPDWKKCAIVNRHA
jgi:hypothetical protein